MTIAVPTRLIAVCAMLLALPPALAAQATGSVSGRVVESPAGRPVSGAQVFIPATRQGAVANDSGAFTIARVPAGVVIVRVQMLGFEPVQQQVTVADGKRATVTFSVRRTAVTLSDVVVTATGVSRKKEIGNALASVDSSVLVHAPVTNTQDILGARSTGVTVMANSGQPGSGGVIRLRGVNSVSQGNAPIVYVDGIRIYNGTTGTTAAASRQSTLPLNDIDASDIDHVEIVKGPAATTLYGTEASGGVIQIFTRRGHSGRAAWDAQIGAGVNNMGHVGPSSDPTGLFVNECRGSNLVNGLGATFEDPTCPSSGSWLRNGPVRRYALSVRGGTSDISYFIGSNYNQEAGVLPAGGNRDNGLRGNFAFHPATGFEVGLNSGYTNRQVDWVADGNNGSGFLLNVSRGPNSNFKGAGCSDPNITCTTNSGIFTQSSFTRSNHYITGFNVSYDAEGRFSTRLSAGYDYDDYTVQTLTPFGFPRLTTGELLQTLGNRTLATVDYAANWRQQLFGLQTTSSVGGQVFDTHLRRTDLQSDQFSGPGLPVLTSGSLRTVNAVDDQRVMNTGFFLQELVGWRDRVFVTGGLRMDGNSAFGKSFGLQAYPKLSVSYVVSEEPWWTLKRIETVKLRGAIGESGKAPGAFDAVRTWTPVAAENGQPAFTPAQIGNPDLGPERTRELELGFDVSALAGRVGVNATWYQQHTFDALIPVTFPPSNGFLNTQLQNVGQLQNNGIELLVNGDLVRSPLFDWSARVNYTTIDSKALNLGGQTITVEALTRTYVKEGYPVPAYWGYKVTNPDEIADPKVDSSAFLGATFPSRVISPGMSLTFRKNLKLDVVGEWQVGGHLLNATAYQNANLDVWQPCYDVRNKLRAYKNGDTGALAGVTALQRARCTITGSQRDYAYWIEPSDFFKLRSVSISYDLPPRLVRGATSASITLAGRNLWKSTGYTGTDPEVADQRDNTFSRRDYYVFPTFRTFVATLRLGF